MPSYDSLTFVPPAPVAGVTLVNSRNGFKEIDVPMLLDTGADITLVPQFAVVNLDVDWSAAAEFELAGFDDHRTICKAIRLDLQFGGKTFRGEYPVIDQGYGILGRNVLNLCKIEYDGQNLSWNII